MYPEVTKKMRLENKGFKIGLIKYAHRFKKKY